MPRYKKLLIQQQTVNGSTYTNIGRVVDTFADFKVVCQEFPFKHLPEMKDLPVRDWHDEDGEDVYIPVDGMKAKAYDVEAKFLYVGDEASMATDLRNMTEYLCGRVNVTQSGVVRDNVVSNVMLAVYDEYTQTGRRGVYVSDVSNELFFYDDANEEAIAQFKVKFRVTDPVTDVILT